MLNILRITGFHDISIFYLGNHEETNIYYLEVDDPNEINARIIMKDLLLHNTKSNTVVTYHLACPANDFSGLLNNGVLYYCQYSQKDSFLHIHKLNFALTPINSSKVAVSLVDVIGDTTIFRTEMKGIDERYCLFGCSTSRTYETTHLLLIDFEEQTYYNVPPHFGFEDIPGIEKIFKLKNTSSNSIKEQIILITGGFHWKEKYEVWENKEIKNSGLDKLTEQIMTFEKESFFRSLKTGESLVSVDISVLERCFLHQSIISYEYDETTLTYIVADFEKNITKGVNYNIDSGTKITFEYGSIVNEPMYVGNNLYSIETFDYGRHAILDLHTEKFLIILESDEKVLAFDQQYLITCKWLNSARQQMIYFYDLSEKPIEQKFAGIGYSHYSNKQLTIFS